MFHVKHNIKIKFINNKKRYTHQINVKAADFRP